MKTGSLAADQFDLGLCDLARTADVANLGWRDLDAVEWLLHLEPDPGKTIRESGNVTMGARVDPICCGSFGA